MFYETQNSLKKCISPFCKKTWWKNCKPEYLLRKSSELSILETPCHFSLIRTQTVALSIALHLLTQKTPQKLKLACASQSPNTLVKSWGRYFLRPTLECQQFLFLLQRKALSRNILSFFQWMTTKWSQSVKNKNISKIILIRHHISFMKYINTNYM